MEQLMKMLRSTGQISVQLSNEFGKDATRSILKQGDFFETVNHSKDGLIFIERGLLMASTLIEGSRQAMWFKKEFEFVILLRKVVKGMAIEALEDTVIWSWPASIVENWLRYYRAFDCSYEECLRDEILRWDEQDVVPGPRSAVKYYAFLKDSDPDLLSRIPPNELASYMLISEKKLSKIVNGDV